MYKYSLDRVARLLPIVPGIITPESLMYHRYEIDMYVISMGLPQISHLYGCTIDSITT